jgi:hypothetical protein
MIGTDFGGIRAPARRVRPLSGISQLRAQAICQRQRPASLSLGGVGPADRAIYLLAERLGLCGVRGLDGIQGGLERPFSTVVRTGSISSGRSARVRPSLAGIVRQPARRARWRTASGERPRRSAACA